MTVRGVARERLEGWKGGDSDRYGGPLPSCSFFAPYTLCVTYIFARSYTPLDACIICVCAENTYQHLYTSQYDRAVSFSLLTLSFLPTVTLNCAEWRKDGRFFSGQNGNFNTASRNGPESDSFQSGVGKVLNSFPIRIYAARE